eukprot:TRINITY_DN57541_c0_g1_i1.p2 TRINITY_DN57541_c0_g1~~TRINITY_DN57541_c0_g1_i1.p2  ORF type:complete len:198 (-),score=18.93 TRINITY_DN57541_c0_g1_i1:1582-2151(-)
MSEDRTEILTALAAELKGHDDCINTLLRLLNNIIKDPTEQKYRQIRVTNATLQQKVFSVTNAFDFLIAMGWEDQGEHLNAATVALDDIRIGKAILESLVPAPVGAPSAPPQPVTPPRAHNAVAEQRNKEIREKMEEQRRQKDLILQRSHADQAFKAKQHAGASKAENLKFGGNINKFSDVGVDLNRAGG